MTYKEKIEAFLSDNELELMHLQMYLNDKGIVCVSESDYEKLEERQDD